MRFIRHQHPEKITFICLTTNPYTLKLTYLDYFRMIFKEP